MAQAKRGRVIVRRQGWFPWQGRGHGLAQCVRHYPAVHHLPAKYLTRGHSARPYGRVSDRRRTAVRLAVLATAFVSLLAVVALASRAGLPWSGTSGEAEGRSLAVLGRLTVDLLLVALTIGLLGAFVLRMLRARRRPLRPADDVEDEDEADLGRVRKFLIRIAPYLLLALIVVVAYLFAREVDRLLPGAEPSPESPAGETGSGSAPLDTARDAADWVLIAAGGLVLLVLAVGAVAPLARGRFGASRVGDESDVEGLSRVLDESIDDLMAEPDPRRAVIAAYARMESGLAARGHGRHTFEAPLEYLARLLTGATEDRESIRRLTALFERAKFSSHPIGPAAKTDAIACLVAIRSGLT
jgi:hypothetical protein